LQAQTAGLQRLNLQWLGIIRIVYHFGKREVNRSSFDSIWKVVFEIKKEAGHPPGNLLISGVFIVR
jgi:hypothetical protein